MSGPITDFGGRVVVITGGANGIGRALAEAFAAEGAHLVLADIEKPLLDETAEKLADSRAASVTGIVTDVSDPASVDALAEAVFAQHGACHVLLNNAGVGAPSANVWDTTPNDWRWVHTVNVFGVAYGIQSFVPRMIASSSRGRGPRCRRATARSLRCPSALVYQRSRRRWP